MAEKLDYAAPGPPRKRFWEAELGCVGSILVFLLILVLGYCAFVLYCWVTGTPLLPPQS
jgi:hypothetical protein